MKAAIYDPYLDSLGGGERYMMMFASVLRDEGYKVDIEFSDNCILSRIENRLGIDMTNMTIVDSIHRGEGYDLCLWLSDGSVPLLKSRNNILHFQRPFHNVDGSSLINRMKFYRINTVVVNSKFTKEWIDKEYPTTSVVLYPPVDTENFKSGKKENIILSVGRFSHLEQSKRQDIIVDAFKNMYDSPGSEFRKRKWRLILSGGSDVGRTEYVDQLKKSAKTYPIDIYENLPFDEVVKLYKKAKIFITAAGFEIDGMTHPEKLEHFGITVVEAMSAGAVPVAYRAGGHTETITEGETGFLWSTKDELMEKCEGLVLNSKLIITMKSKMQEESRRYSNRIFKENVKQLL